MAKAWYICIVGGTKLYSKCPAKYKAAVDAFLKANVDSGRLTEERFRELISK